LTTFIDHRHTSQRTRQYVDQVTFRAGRSGQFELLSSRLIRSITDLIAKQVLGKSGLTERPEPHLAPT
jgi:hypothetical protein